MKDDDDMVVFDGEDAWDDEEDLPRVSCRCVYSLHVQFHVLLMINWSISMV